MFAFLLTFKHFNFYTNSESINVQNYNVSRGLSSCRKGSDQVGFHLQVQSQQVISGLTIHIDLINLNPFHYRLVNV